MSPEPAWVVWGIFGSLIGSFLNVCIYRMPREQSVISPRSRCPGCGHPIAWYDNIPLVSFALLRGACRHCRAPIRWHYPVVELLTAGLTVAVLAQFGVTPVGLVYLVFVYGLIVASFIDLEFRIIPDEISLGGLGVGLLCSLLVPALHGTESRWLALGWAGVGALVGGGVLYVTGVLGDTMLGILRRLGIALRRRPFWRAKLARYRHMKESMGGGDVKLMAMAGSVLGWKLVALAFFVAPCLAVLPGFFILLVKRAHYIPYGPFLSLALVGALFVGGEFLRVTGIEETSRLLWDYYVQPR